VVGPPYPRNVRLALTATGNWTRIDGQYSGQGVELLNLPFSRFLSVVEHWALERMTGEDAERWLAELDRPLPGTPDGQFSEEDEMEQLKYL
jgi:hypothetical protein